MLDASVKLTQFDVLPGGGVVMSVSIRILNAVGEQLITGR